MNDVPANPMLRGAIILVCVLVGRATGHAQAAPAHHRLTLSLDAGYERTALNYSLLLADTTGLSPDSLEQLQKSSDTQTEPYAGLRVRVGNRQTYIDNGVYYTESGWRDRLDGRARVPLSSVFEAQGNARFEYRPATKDDSLLADYWTLAGDARLLAELTASHTVFVRADWEHLQYPRHPPPFGYDFDRVRSRVGWRWQSNRFDFAELAAGVGNRLVSDSADREYTERFAAGYLDLTPADKHRLLVAISAAEKDYRSADPRDDYLLASGECRWEFRSRWSSAMVAAVRWDYWDFRAEDEVTFDFHEVESSVELRLPAGDDFAFRLGPQYRFTRAAATAFSGNNYRQPSGVLGLEYSPLSSVWIDSRFEIGYRDYKDETTGYTDFTDVKLDLSAEIGLGRRVAISGGISYERELHALDSDNTDLLFFTFMSSYRILK